MNQISFGIFSAGLIWTVLTGLMTFGVWSFRKRSWVLGTVSLLVALPYPLMSVFGMIAMNRANSVLQKGHVPIYMRITNIESALKSDTLSLKSKSTLSKLVARDHFVFEGKIENIIEEDGSVTKLSPDSSDRELMINMKISQKFVESINTFGLLFLSAIFVGLFAGILIPLEIKTWRSLV